MNMSDKPSWRKLSAILTLALSIPTLIQVANAQSVGAFVTDTDYSGQSTNNPEILALNSIPNAVVTGITARERRDTPCDIAVRFNDLSNVTMSDRSRFVSFIRCKNKSNDTGRGSAASGQFIHLNKPGVVNELRVCRRGDAIKGIQVRGVFPGCMLGTMAGVPNGVSCNERNRNRLLNESFERPNCPGSDRGPDQHWETTTAKCPDGTVATAVLLSVSPVSDFRRSINGIALRCHELLP